MMRNFGSVFDENFFHYFLPLVENIFRFAGQYPRGLSFATQMDHLLPFFIFFDREDGVFVEFETVFHFVAMFIFHTQEISFEELEKTRLISFLFQKLGFFQ